MAGNEQLALFDSTGPFPRTDRCDTLRPLPPAQTLLTEKTDLPQVPIVRPATLPTGCRWQEVATSSQTIGFMLRTSRRKTIGLTISDDGLIVTVPGWVTRKRIAEAVQEKAPWILRKLRDLRARQQHLATADARWQDGGCFPYLGVYIALAIRPEIGTPRFTGDPRIPAHDDILYLPLQAGSGADRVRERVYAWLQQQARSLFEDRLSHFCALAGVTLAGWRLASPGGRWGSCTSDGRIMLNWRLIHFAPDVVDYVVAHEVAHLRHMNHGPDFWREVGRLCPDFGRARQALKPHHPGSLPLL